MTFCSPALCPSQWIKTCTEEQWGEIWEPAKCGSNVIVAWPRALIHINCFRRRNLTWASRFLSLHRRALVTETRRRFFISSLSFFFFQLATEHFCYVSGGGADRLACKHITKKQFRWKSIRCAVLGCDCCLSDTGESLSVLEAARRERFDVTLPRDLGPFLNHICY